MKSRIKNLNSEKGASTVEFALVIPILIMLLFAILQFGLAFSRYVSLTHAAREGARLAAVGLYEEDPGGFEQAVRDSAPAVEIETINVDPGEGTIGSTVEVTVIGSTFLIEIPMAGSWGPITLTSKASMRREQ
ncbi:hypothetical protein A2V94_03405 [Candidatus Atribacteria bacterium RBG_16_35_8]|nr:MAG: hypothetical protein A2V94_03405 [Candidatus Atribacteria bacterium RBG_16_35_8]